MKIVRMESQHKDQKGRKGPRNMGRSQRNRIGLQVLRLEMGMANTSQMRKNHEVENRSLTNQKQPWGGDWTAISQAQCCGEH